MNIQNIYDLVDKEFNFVIMPRGYGRRKFEEERKNKMKVEIKKQVVFSEEEAKLLREAVDRLKEISCIGIDCKNCPFCIHTNENLEFKCAINIIHHIYATYILSNDND